MNDSSAGKAARPLREYGAGLAMMVIGLVAVAEGMTYGVGTLSAMGPGYFPVALGVMLALIGVGIAASRPDAEPPAGASPHPAPVATQRVSPSRWRGPLCIVGGIAAFIVLGRYGGLLPASFAIVFVSALGDRANNWRHALGLALIISAICIVVFWWALKLPMPLFSWNQ